MKICKTKGCVFPVFSKGFCRYHTPKKPIKKKNPVQLKRIKITHISDRHKETLSLYKKVRLDFLNKNKRCMLKLSTCTGAAVCVHHMKGKDSREDYLDVKNFMASCINCNNEVERIGQKAYDLGLKIRKHST